MLIISNDLAEAIKHIRNKCRITRLSKYLNGEGKQRHPLVIIKEQSKEK